MTPRRRSDPRPHGDRPDRAPGDDDSPDGLPAHRDDPPRAGRPDTPDVIELKQLKDAQPELGPAVDMQIALIAVQRRVRSRISIPALSADEARVQRHAAERRRFLVFDDIPIDWTDLRLMVRQTVDILYRFDSLDAEASAALQAVAREPERFQVVVRAWYDSAGAEGLSDALADDETGLLDQILTLAMRPFLACCAEVLLPQLDLSGWSAARCPLCGGEPEFAAITPAADRLLLCGRCTGAWPFDPVACPFCLNDDRARITSFASRDGRYRLYGCDQCRRYLKAFDGRRATRGARLAVDTIATLPLDAAAMQKGYTG